MKTTIREDTFNVLDSRNMLSTSTYSFSVSNVIPQFRMSQKKKISEKYREIIEYYSVDRLINGPRE